MNNKTQVTTGQIMKDILSEVSQLDLANRLRVLGFVLQLRIRRQRHKTLNAALSALVILLAILLVLQAVRP